jgi:2,4-didehydro-3-deoxy-L-rhamnonate hydrolase
MKLLRYGPVGQERPGLLDPNGTIRDLSDLIPDLSGDALLPETLARLRSVNASGLPAVAGSPRIGACVGHVGKLIGIGLNYSDHAAESNMAVPSEPIVFMKAVSCVSGPYDDIVMPPGSQKTDWEVELGVVIGRPAKYVTEADALAHVAGYCVVHDVSERSYQLEGTGQWTKGKSADTFGPIGPWLVTPDEVPDWNSLDLWLDVNGRRFQQGSTRTMVFGVPYLVSYLSRFMSLQPGDVIATGTPPGVGLGHKPPIFLKEGDDIRLSVAGLGEQRQRVVSYRG